MIGDYRHLVTFQDPGPALPDGVGGYTETWADLAPSTWYVSLNQPAAGDLERISGGGSVITAGSYLVRGRYHPDVSTKTRMLFSGRTFSITGTRNVDERAVTMELAVVEQIPSPVVGPPPMAPYAAQVVADGASHYWRLGEPSGTITVDSIGTAHGTISGGVTLNQPGALTDGDKSMLFDGLDDKVVTVTNITVPVVYTLEAWIKVIDLIDRPIFSINPGETPRWGVANKKLALYDGANGTGLAGGIALTDGVWHHVVLVQGATSITFYVNGVFDQTTPFGRTIPKTSLGEISYDSAFPPGNPSGFWAGPLDEVALYPHALTPEQIAAHYAAATTAQRRRR